MMMRNDEWMDTFILPIHLYIIYTRLYISFLRIYRLIFEERVWSVEWFKIVVNINIPILIYTLRTSPTVKNRSIDTRFSVLVLVSSSISSSIWICSLNLTTGRVWYSLNNAKWKHTSNDEQLEIYECTTWSSWSESSKKEKQWKF